MLKFAQLLWLLCDALLVATDQAAVWTGELAPYETLNVDFTVNGNVVGAHNVYGTVSSTGGTAEAAKDLRVVGVDPDLQAFLDSTDKVAYAATLSEDDMQLLLDAAARTMDGWDPTLKTTTIAAMWELGLAYYPPYDEFLEGALIFGTPVAFAPGYMPFTETTSQPYGDLESLCLILNGNSDTVAWRAYLILAIISYTPVADWPAGWPDALNAMTLEEILSGGFANSIDTRLAGLTFPSGSVPGFSWYDPNGAPINEYEAAVITQALRGGSVTARSAVEYWVANGFNPDVIDWTGIDPL